MDLQLIGRILVIGGIVAVILGGLFLLLARIPFFNNLENLPTIQFQGQNFTCLFPIGAMIILSILLTIILNIVIRLINRP